MIDVGFALTDHDERPVDLSSYAGKWLLVFFGFTHCRMVCPRNLAKLSSVLEKLSAIANGIVPLYITVDPERDTPERMKDWLLDHYPRFTGLTGDRTSIDAARSQFRVFAERRASGDEAGGYDVPHSALTYLIGPDGEYRTHFNESVSDDEIAARIAGLMRPETSDAEH